MTIPRMHAITNAMPDKTGKPAFTLSINESFSSIVVGLVMMLFSWCKVSDGMRCVARKGPLGLYSFQS